MLETDEDYFRLSHGLRALASRLVMDEASADDLVQDAWLAALTQSRAPVRNRGAWLRQVVRNVAYRDRQRARRRGDVETLSAAPESHETEAVELERRSTATWLRQMAAELREPYRGVLVQHYFEGRSVAEIARAEERPLETVKSQVKRGVRELRSALDRRHGDRKAWAALLAPLLSRDDLPRADAMGQPTPLSSPRLALALGVAAGTALVLWTTLGSNPPRATGAAGPAVAAADSAVEPAQPAREVPRGEEPDGARQPAAEERPATPHTPQTRSLEIIVTRPDGSTPEHSYAHVSGKDAQGIGSFGSDETGVIRVAVPVDKLSGPPRVVGPHGGVSVTARASDGVWTPLHHVSLPPEGRVLELTSEGPALTIKGTVVDETGRPIDESFIGVEPQRWKVSATDGGFQLPERDYSQSLHSSDFSLVGLPRRPHHLTARAPGFLPDRQVVGGESAGVVEVQLVLRTGATLHGMVRYTGGGPAEGALVFEVGMKRAGQAPLPRSRVGADGRFEIGGVEPGPRRFFARDAGRPELYSSAIIDVPDGGVAVWDTELALQTPLQVRVEEEDGTPVPNPMVVVMQHTEPAWGMALPGDAAGRARFDLVPAGDLSVVVGRSMTSGASASVDGVRPTPDDLVVSIGPVTKRLGSAAGFVVDHEGLPLESAVVVGCAGGSFEATTEPRTGSFESGPIEAGSYTLWALIPGRGRGFLGHCEVREEPADLGTLQVDPPETVTFEWGTVASAAPAGWVVGARAPCSPLFDNIIHSGDELPASLSLLPGEYRVRSTAVGSPFELEFDVAAGEGAHVRVE